MASCGVVFAGVGGNTLSHQPIAFMSYVRQDDQHENGRLTQFRERLSGEVRMQTGDAFEIFQDRQDIAWGQQWKTRIDESLDQVTFLIPMITPAFFKSAPCRAELERFLEREASLGRTDLILPVYYVESDTLSIEAKRERDPLAAAIAARQFVDWREIRFEPFATPEVGKMLAKIARQIVAALGRESPAPSDAARHVVVAAAPAAAPPAKVDAQAPPEDKARTAHGSATAPVAKTQAPVLVVDALYRGDHATLTQALKVATPGTRILVRPGLYREGILIDKPVEIIGDGEQGDVVIEASGKDAILFRADMGRVSNLTLRQVGGGKWFGVDIAQGRLDLEGCDISSQSLACVAIHGGADPRLRRNRIHSGKQSGVFVFENGLGTLEDNEIFANEMAGVSIKEGGNPVLRRNLVRDGMQSGVHIYNKGRGVLEDNDIFANALAGVSISGGGHPVLRRNRIHDGKQGASTSTRTARACWRTTRSSPIRTPTYRSRKAAIRPCVATASTVGSRAG